MNEALITAAVEQAMKGIKSQELLFALAVLVLSMAMLFLGGKLFVSMTNKRDDTIKGLMDEMRASNTTLSRITELQNMDLQATAHNRDLLQSSSEHLGRIDQCLSILKLEIAAHAVECRQKVLKP